MHCPRCRVRLARSKVAEGVYFHCPRCNGRAVAISLLRRMGSKESIRRLWQQARNGAARPGTACPVCEQATAEVLLPIRSSSPPLPLDVCTRCEFVWFDPREFEAFAACRPPAPPPLPEKTREAIAMAEIRRVAEQAEQEAYGESGPEEMWHWLPGLLGMPVEENAPPLKRFPWVTWGLAAAIVAVFALTFRGLPSVIADYGLVPANLWRHDGVTFLTSFFLHAGLFHLIGNVYFLLIFGDNVEDDLGRWRYALLLAAAAIFGDLLHILSDPGDMRPCVGASGGISGVIAYYALQFPQARLGIAFRFSIYFRWVRFPAFIGLLVWIALQLTLAIAQRDGLSNVAAFAHLGGAAVGAAVWAIKRIGSRREAQTV